MEHCEGTGHQWSKTPKCTKVLIVHIYFQQWALVVVKDREREVMVYKIAASDLRQDPREWPKVRLNGHTVTRLASAATVEWVKGEKRVSERGVCAAECDNREDKGKRQNECRGNTTGRWRKWDRGVKRQMELRVGCQDTNQVKEGGRIRAHVSPPQGTVTENIKCPLVLTFPCELLLSFAVSLPRFHWALQWSFLIPEHQKQSVRETLTA